MTECAYHPRLLNSDELRKLSGGSMDLLEQLWHRNRALERAMAKEGLRWDWDIEDWVKRCTD